MEHVTVSVLICTFNRPEMLQRALTALVEKTSEKPDEIIIVNGGDERADNVIRQFIGRYNIVTCEVKTVNKNLATSRNLGLHQVSGEIVAMTDDDAEVFPDWITQIKRVHAEHPEVGAVGGAVLGAHSKDSFLSRVADIVTFVSPTEPTYVRTVPGVNVAYKRTVIDQLGPQDEMLFRGEDVDYNWRVKQLGYQVYYHPSIKVIHHHRPTLVQFLRQHYMYGRAYYLVRHKWPEMYCVYPHHFRRLKDYLKAMNFFAAIVYQPILMSRKLSHWQDSLKALPFLFILQLAWKGGMIVQKFS